MTSICGLGQVALGPVLSVLGMDRGGAAAREHPKDRAGHRDLDASRVTGSGDPSGVLRRPDRGRGARGLPAGTAHRRSRAVALAEATGACPAEPVRAPHDLPGFARSTVDGFAVRAADTYGASEGLPSYLDVTGARGDGPRAGRRGGARRRRRDADGRRDARGRRRGRHGRAHAGGDAGHDRGHAAGRAGRRASSAPTRTRARAPSCCRPAARCARRTSGCSPPPA